MIQFDHVSKVYPNGTVGLDDVNLTIQDGEFVAIIGRSGAGKSTLLRSVNRMHHITSGTLMVNGINVSTLSGKSLRRFRRGIGMVFQSFNLVTRTTVIKNVLSACVPDMPFWRVLLGIFRREDKMKALESLDKVGILDKAYIRADQLSGGQQQRVALARAVVIEPSVLLFDEPLSNLDAKLRESMRDELRALQQRLGITSLYVTHDQSEAMAISDKVVIMKDGVICQQGTPQEIYEQPASRFVANFIGKANFIDGIFKGRDGEAALVEIGGKTFSIPAPGKMEGVEVGGACCLTVRPESFLLTKDAGALPGTVSRATYYGAKIEYEVMLNEQPIIVEVYNPQLSKRFAEGEAVHMTLIDRCVRVLA